MRHNPTDHNRNKLTVHTGNLKQPPRLPQTTHSGPVPKGCTVTRHKFTFEKDGYNLSIGVDIVHSTRKGFLKKLPPLTHELAKYLGYYSINHIISEGKFTVIKNLHK